MTDDDLAPALRGIEWDTDLPADHATTVLTGVRRRRRQRGGIAAALATAAVVAGVSVVSATTGSTADQALETADRTEAPSTRPFPAPPDGAKWVGVNGLVLAVPAEWPVLSSPCGDGSPGVVLDGTRSATAKCLHDEVTSVSLVPLNGATGGQSEGGIACLDSFPASCFQARAFPNQDVLVRISSEDPDAERLIARILDSAMTLPDGWTTVPFTGENRVSARVGVLEEAGFEVDTSQVLDTADGPVTTDPTAGSPVREGATVAVVPGPRELSVDVRRVAAEDDPGQPVGSARWDPDTQALTYLDDTPVSRCGVDATASGTGTAVELVLTAPLVDGICVDLGQATAVTVDGLATRPTELVVIRLGERVSVPIR